VLDDPTVDQPAGVKDRTRPQQFYWLGNLGGLTEAMEM
jgi:hypothetical protein